MDTLSSRLCTTTTTTTGHQFRPFDIVRFLVVVVVLFPSHARWAQPFSIVALLDPSSVVFSFFSLVVVVVVSVVGECNKSPASGRRNFFFFFFFGSFQYVRHLNASPVGTSGK
jgi:hypothetical protein